MFLLTLLLLAPPDAPPSPWRFVLPAPGAPDEHAPPRALPLSARKPDDVEELAAFAHALPDELTPVAYVSLLERVRRLLFLG